MGHIPVRSLSVRSFFDVRDMTSSTFASNIISLKILFRC